PNLCQGVLLEQRFWPCYTDLYARSTTTGIVDMRLHKLQGFLAEARAKLDYQTARLMSYMDELSFYLEAESKGGDLSARFNYDVLLEGFEQAIRRHDWL